MADEVGKSWQQRAEEAEARLAEEMQTIDRLRQVNSNLGAQISQMVRAPLRRRTTGCSVPAERRAPPLASACCAPRAGSSPRR